MMQEKIDNLKKDFRLLNDWEIKYVNECKEFLQESVGIHKLKKYAVIRRPYFPEKDQTFYIIHELLHCALEEINRTDKRKIRELYEKEEILVQDICKIIEKY